MTQRTIEQIARIIESEYNVSKRGEITNYDDIARAIVNGLNLSPQPVNDVQTGLNVTGKGDCAANPYECAYGLLWRDMNCSEMGNKAREILLEAIGRDGAKRGVAYAVNQTGPITDAEIYRFAYSVAETETTPDLLQEDLGKPEVTPTRYWRAWNATPDAVDPCPKDTVWVLHKSGSISRILGGSMRHNRIWRNSKEFPDAEIIAYCPGDIPPEKDADGYWPHDGSDVSPISGDEAWRYVSRFKLVGGER